MGRNQCTANALKHVANERRSLIHALNTVTTPAFRIIANTFAPAIERAPACDSHIGGRRSEGNFGSHQAAIKMIKMRFWLRVGFRRFHQRSNSSERLTQFSRSRWRTSGSARAVSIAEEDGSPDSH